MSRSLPLRRALFSLLAGALAPAPASAQELLGPLPYLSFADSPFAAATFGSFHLEDFEDGVLDVPGVAIAGGNVIGPSALTDSVDADDGAIDGSGQGGHSLLSTSGSTIAITFDAAALGGALPTHAGVVWTDVGFALPADGFAVVELEAFAAGGASLGTTAATLLGDGSATSATAEDRFLGAVFAGGIARLEVRCTDSPDWEIDHLQYGRALGTFGSGCPGSGGCTPFLSILGVPIAGGPIAISISSALGGAPAFIAFGQAPAALPIGFGCTLAAAPILVVAGPLPIAGSGPCHGTFLRASTIPPAAAGASFALQAFIGDPTAPGGFSASNGVAVAIP